MKMDIIKNIDKINLIMNLRSMGIHCPKILSAIEEIPRELFVAKHLSHYAYENTPLPIGFNQTISQPYIVALMTEKLALKKTTLFWKLAQVLDIKHQSYQN